MIWLQRVITSVVVVVSHEERLGTDSAEMMKNAINREVSSGDAFLADLAFRDWRR